MLKKIFKVVYSSFLFFYKIPSRQKLIVLLLIDNFLILLSLYITLSILSFFNTNNIFANISSIFYLFPLSLFLGSFIYFYTGHFKPITRFIGSTDCYKIFLRNLVLSIFISLLFKTSLVEIRMLSFITFLTFMLSNFLELYFLRAC